MSFRLPAAVTLSACLLALGACGVISDPEQVLPTNYIEEPTISPAAVAEFGQQPVEAAHQELAAFALERAFPVEFLNPQKDRYTPGELTTDVQDHLTEEMAVAWSDLVASALAGDAAAQESVRSLQFYDLDDPTSALPPDSAPIDNQAIVGSSIDVEPSPTGPEVRLVITWEHTAALDLVDLTAGADEHYTLNITKDFKVWLTPSTAPSGPRWLITQYDGSYTADVPEDQ